MGKRTKLSNIVRTFPTTRRRENLGKRIDFAREAFKIAQHAFGALRAGDHDLSILDDPLKQLCNRRYSRELAAEGSAHVTADASDDDRVVSDVVEVFEQ